MEFSQEELQGSTTILPFNYDQDQREAIVDILRTLNRLEIPFKHCWSIVNRTPPCYVYYKYLNLDLY